MSALLNGHTNGHANHANRLPVDPTPEEIAARAAQCRANRNENRSQAQPIAVPIDENRATADDLDGIDAAILKAATTESQSAKRLAKAAGYKYSP